MKNILNKINNNDKLFLFIGVLFYMMSVFIHSDVLFVTSFAFTMFVIAVNAKNDSYNKEISFKEVFENKLKYIDDCYETGKMLKGFINTIALYSYGVLVAVSVLGVIVLLL